jgi:hypothetical protein
MNEPLDLQCQNRPTEKQTRRAKWFFGEGFLWACPDCGLILALTRGKGNYWYWKDF